MGIWKENDNSLEAKIKFEDFKEAWGFLSKVAIIAEEMNHHPDWRNVYNQVEIRLTTHDKGNAITEKDRQMAAAIEKLLA